MSEAKRKRESARAKADKDIAEAETAVFLVREGLVVLSSG